MRQIAPALSASPARRLVMLLDPLLQLQANLLAGLGLDRLLVVSTQAFGRAGNR